MTICLRRTTVVTFVGLLLAPAAWAQHTAMPPGMSQEEHMAKMKKDAEMKQHGNLAMGFAQDKTTHHFNLAADGGSIAVDANDPADRTSRDQIREHATGDPLTLQDGAAHMPDHGAQQGGTQGTAPQADHFDRHFDNADEWAKSFDDPARDEWQLPARVIEALQLKPGQVIADIGAGTGYFTVRLAKSLAAPKVYAVDIEPSMVDYVTRRATHDGLKNVSAVLGGADRSNLPQPVDLVLVVDTYHHIPNRVAYFTGLKAQMKPGARLAIVDFRKGAPSGPPEEFRMMPEQIDAELSRAGFVRQATHDFLPRQLFLIYSAK